MTIRTTFQCAKPDDIEFQLSVTATISDFKLLINALSGQPNSLHLANAVPLIEFRRQLTVVVERASETFGARSDGLDGDQT